MPKGNPNAQTRATAKYQKKAGYISKNFKMKRDVVDEFVAICHKKGISQAGWLTEQMKKFIEENK